MPFRYPHVETFVSCTHGPIQLRRRYFLKMIMDEKMGLGGESRFDFKYVPTLTRTTRLGERRLTKYERPGLESLARLGLLAVFTALMTLTLGLAFAVKSMPSSPLSYADRV